MTSAAAAGLQGQNAGAVSRVIAFLIDLAVSAISLSAVVAGFVVVLDLITGSSVTLRAPAVLGIPATTVWFGLYLLVSWAVPGRTPGMAVFGLLVVCGDGTEVGWGHAAIRTLALPLSFIGGIGLLGIVLGGHHRALHDVIADTRVVFDWQLVDQVSSRQRWAARLRADAPRRIIQRNDSPSAATTSDLWGAGMPTRAERDPEAAEFYANSWWLFVVTGTLWLLLGFMVLSYRPASISITVLFVAIVFWMGALSALALAVVTRGAPRWIALSAAVFALGAGVGALVWPSPTLLIVSVFIAWYLLLRGIVDVVIALANTGIRGWWIVLLNGIISIALGAWAVGNPDRSTLLLITIVGIYAVFHGGAELVAGFQYRQLRRELGLA